MDNATASPFRLAVLNPGGRDPDQFFPDGVGDPNDPRAAHPPVNYHAYAACVGGSFYANEKAALAAGWPILLLLRRDLKSGWRCLQRLKVAGRTVAVTFKEAGALQVAARLTRPADFELLRAILALADGALAPTPWLAEFFRGVCPRIGRPGIKTAFIPTPYPVDDPRWDFSVPMQERQGIFIGTREIDTPSRQHLAALAAGRKLNEITGSLVTVLNPDGRRGAKFLAAVGYTADLGYPDSLRVLPGPLPYLTYLREMARHKLVFQLDRSAVPGQVAGDALLCGVPCVGGDGTVEGLAFPELSGHGREPAALIELAVALLDDPHRYEQACRDARTCALETVSFTVVARKLAAFFAGLPGK